MNAQSNNEAAKPALARLIALAYIGELTLAHHSAEHAAKSAKRRYHEAIAKYESQHDELPYGQIDPHDIDCAPVIAASKDEFVAYRAARRAAYNIKRRLDNACRKAVQP